MISQHKDRFEFGFPIQLRVIFCLLALMPILILLSQNFYFNSNGQSIVNFWNQYSRTFPIENCQIYFGFTNLFSLISTSITIGMLLYFSFIGKWLCKEDENSTKIKILAVLASLMYLIGSFFKFPRKRIIINYEN